MNRYNTAYFHSKLDEAIVDLQNLMGYRFKDRQDTNTAIGWVIGSIRVAHEKGGPENLPSWDDRNLHVCRLLYLAADLKTVKNYSQQEFEKFRTDLRNNDRNNQTFWGIRFELHVASLLAQKNIQFQKSESPDFILPDSLFIECGSARVTINTPGKELSYKISAAINKKNGKSYANKKCILFLDYTNIINKTMLNKSQLDIDSAVKDCLSALKYSSVILIMWYFDLEKTIYNTGYKRYDAPDCDPNVKKFLDLHFPFGRMELPKFGIATEA